MEISDESRSALNEWLGPDTWDTDDYRDNNRYYHFVRTLWNCNSNRHGIDELALRELITRHVAENHGQAVAADIEAKSVIEKMVSRACMIFEYHEANDDESVFADRR